MLDSLKEVLKKSLPCEVVKYRRDRKALKSWKKQGRKTPPPHIIKEALIGEYARNFQTKILIETGTYLGDMVYAMKNSFSLIVSFELDKTLAEKARERFSSYKHITIVQGDSGELLKMQLQSIREPCLFWLDGHYSGGITAKAALNTPIENELRAILSHPVTGHVILIDDARCFTGEDDYPSLKQLKQLVSEQKPDRQFSVKDDIIRIHI